jgi:hypothetical protein
VGELELGKKDLERMKKESMMKLEELRRLESSNTKMQSEKYELKIEELEA